MKIDSQLKPLLDAAETAPLNAHKFLLLRSGASLLLVAMLLGLLTGIEPLNKACLVNPRIALGAHMVGGAYSIILMVLGVMWPSLAFTPVWSRRTAWILIWGFWLSIVVAMTAAVIGVVPGDPLYPVAGGTNKVETHNPFVIAFLYGGVSLTAFLEIAGMALVIFAGLRLGRRSPGLTLNPSPEDF
jgi:hypothetical protein